MIPEPFIYEHLFWRRQNVQVNVIKCLHLQVTYLPSGLAGTFSGLSVTSGPILTFTIRIAVVFRWASLAAILTATKIKTQFSYLTQKIMINTCLISCSYFVIFWHGFQRKICPNGNTSFAGCVIYKYTYLKKLLNHYPLSQFNKHVQNFIMKSKN